MTPGGLGIAPPQVNQLSTSLTPHGPPHPKNHSPSPPHLSRTPPPFCVRPCLVHAPLPPRFFCGFFGAPPSGFPGNWGAPRASGCPSDAAPKKWGGAASTPPAPAATPTCRDPPPRRLGFEGKKPRIGVKTPPGLALKLPQFEIWGGTTPRTGLRPPDLGGLSLQGFLVGRGHSRTTQWHLDLGGGSPQDPSHGIFTRRGRT